MTAELIHLMLEAGLLQFGRFNHAGESVPFRLSLELLPSYPDILRMVAAQAKALLSSLEVSRLLCAADAVPFGVALSLEINVPLVYSRRRSEAPVYDLVGAYDIGHPTLLMTNAVSDFEPLSQLMANARQVGLEVRNLLTIVDLDIVSIPHGIQQLSLLRLPDVIEDLTRSGHLPREQAQTVRHWMNAYAAGEAKY